MRRSRAFTLIEVMLAIIIIAVLSTTLTLTMQRVILKASFDDQVVEITALIEKASAYAFSNFLVNESEPAEYYYLYIQSTGVTLSAINGSDSEILEVLTFEDGFSMSTAASMFYFPPDGTVCFSTDCNDESTSALSVTFQNVDSSFQTSFTITKYGGYPELEEL